MLRWSGQNANQKVGPDKMPTTEKKSRTKCQPRLAFCPVGILSGWHFVLPPLEKGSFLVTDSDDFWCLTGPAAGACRDDDFWCLTEGPNCTF